METTLVAFIIQILCWTTIMAGPTINSRINFNADADADAVRSSVKGRGTEDERLNGIICPIPYIQRIEISRAFSRLFNNKDIIERLGEDTSGDQLKLYRRLFMEPTTIGAKEFLDSINAGEVNFGLATEIVCSSDVPDKAIIEGFYNDEHKTSTLQLLEKFKEKDKLYFDVVSNLCWKDWCFDKYNLTAEQVKYEVDLLVNFNLKDVEGFRRRLYALFTCGGCIQDFKIIFESYRTSKNRGFDEIVREVLGGEESDAFATLDLLHGALDGTGTDANRINRIIVGRCEKDLGDIKSDYQCTHEEALSKRIKHDFASEWNYVDCIKHLLGDKNDDSSSGGD